MTKMQPKKSQTTQNEPTQSLWRELSDDVAAQLTGGTPSGHHRPVLGGRVVDPPDDEIIIVYVPPGGNS